MNKIEIRFNKHLNRKNNFLVAGMYQMYISGKSLAQIAKVYKKSRQAVYDVFRTRGYKLRSKEFKDLQILDGIHFTRTKGGYLRGTVNGRRMLMHQYVYEKTTGEKIRKGWVIRHKDGNRQNNVFTNFEYISLSDWNKKYSPHLNQFTSPTGSRKPKGENLRYMWTNGLSKTDYVQKPGQTKIPVAGEMEPLFGAKQVPHDLAQ